ncbi:MAG: hypothetical protein H0U63_03700 [Burkholderiales bacterium]|nr:hypothetical protein [Burkholderiales bacterium]
MEYRATALAAPHRYFFSRMRLQPAFFSALEKRSFYLPAAFGAAATRRNAFIHTARLLAAMRAGLANFRAERTDLKIPFRFTHEETGRRLADVRAIHHQAEMGRHGMRAASFKAVVHGGLKTNTMAFEAILHTVGRIFYRYGH